MDEFLTLLYENPSSISAIAATISVFIALLAILLTLFSLIMQHHHHLKSVVPIANIGLSDYENLIKVEIYNSGIGPLIITQFQARDKDGCCANNLIEFMPSLPKDIYWSTFFQNLENFSIIPSKSLTLLELRGNDKDKDAPNFSEAPRFIKTRDDIRKCLSEIEMTLSYKDIYGREMPEKHKDMKWFARHFNADQENKAPKNLHKTDNKD